MGGDKKRLGYLKQRILGGRVDDSGRQGTTINEDEEEVCMGDEWLLLTHITFKIEMAGRQVETLSIKAKTIEFIS